MSFEVNLDGVEPWGGGVLRKGIHRIRVIEEEIDTSGDHPVVAIQIEATSGEEVGSTLRDWIHYTEKTKGRIAAIYKAFGVKVPEGNFKWIPLLSREAEVVVDEEPRRDGKTDSEGNVLMSSSVRAYRAAGSDPIHTVKQAFPGASVIDADPGPEPDIPF